MAEGSEAALENGITCSLCLHIYQTPKILPCGHIFCRSPCLTELAKQSNSTTVTCPLCRKVADIPQSDVDTFPTVFPILSLIDSFKALEASAERPSNHCQQHNEQELDVFCETCSETLCRDCIIDSTEHQKHAYGSIKKYREKFLKDVERNRARVDDLTRTLDEIEETKASMIREKEEICKNIETEIDRKAAEQKASALSHLTAVTNGRLASLRTQHDELSGTYSELIASLLTAENAVQNLSNSDFVSVKRTVDQLKEVAHKTRSIASLRTDNVRIALQVPQDELFPYSGAPADPCKCTYSRDVEIGEPVHISINVFSADGKACLVEQSVTVELHYLCELAVSILEAKRTSCGQYRVDFTPENRGRHMLAIKVNGEHIFGSPVPMYVRMPPQKLGVPVAKITGLERPGGMLSWNGKILACEYGRNRLIEIDRRHRTFFEVASVKEGPAGLTADSDMNVYVTTFDNRLHKLDRNGKCLRVTGKTGSGRREFKMANGVKVSNNKLYVCDSMNHRIKVYDLELQLLYIFGEFGSKLGQFQKPIDLVFDQAGVMYVTEQLNNRIQVFSSEEVALAEYPFKDIVTLHIHDNLLYVTHHKPSYISVVTTSGQLVTTFGKEDLLHPEEIRTDEDGFVYVTSHENQVIVF